MRTPSSDLRAGRDARPSGRRARLPGWLPARAQLRQVVTGALGESLAQLGERLGLPSAPAPSFARMREVIERDRALLATRPEPLLRAEPPALPSAPPAPPLPPEPRCEAVPEGGEPIRTRTMARLLAAQGYRQRALAVYEELLRAGGDDTELRAEAERVRASAR